MKWALSDLPEPGPVREIRVINFYREVTLPEGQFDFERLDAYQLARQFTRECEALAKRLPPGRGDALDQLRRASMSVPLNIAEGGGEFAAKEKARFYRIAKRSAAECAALLDYLVDTGMTTDREVAPAKTLARRITGTLVKLIHATESSPPSPKRVPVSETSPST